MYNLFRRFGKPVIETFENENVKITRFLNGEVETVLKPKCDPKVKEMYKKLQGVRK